MEKLSKRSVKPMNREWNLKKKYNYIKIEQVINKKKAKKATGSPICTKMY